MCRIHLDEDTKNQTLGLLGTNDDEQANDKRMRNNEVRFYTNDHPEVSFISLLSDLKIHY